MCVSVFKFIVPKPSCFTHFPTTRLLYLRRFLLSRRLSGLHVLRLCKDVPRAEAFSKIIWKQTIKNRILMIMADISYRCFKWENHLPVGYAWV